MQKHASSSIGEEAVEEVDVPSRPRSPTRRSREPVALALVLDHLGVGLAGDQVEHVGMGAMIAGKRRIANSMPLPAEISPKVDSTV